MTSQSSATTVLLSSATTVLLSSAWSTNATVLSALTTTRRPALDLSAHSGYDSSFELITLVLMWFLSLLGNTLVVVVVTRSRRIQSTTNHFVTALAIGDLVFSFLLIPFVLVQRFMTRWPFGSSFCKCLYFVQWLVIGISAFILLSIAIDRFYTIIYPLSFKVTRGIAKKMIMLCLAVAAILAVPSVMLFGNEVDSCTLYLEKDWSSKVYVSILFGIIYLCPILVLLPVYFRISCHIWTFSRETRKFQRTVNSIPRGKIKIVKMLVAVTICHVSGLLPLACVILWWNFSSAETVSSILNSFVIWMTFLSFSTRPIVYLFYNSNFRRGCKEIFCMSTMKCYRSNVYTITNVSGMAKRNHVGVANGTGLSHHQPPNKAFDRNGGLENIHWPLSNGPCVLELSRVNQTPNSS